MRIFLFLSLVVFPLFHVHSQQLIDVGISSETKVQAFVFAAHTGKYAIYTEQGKTMELHPGEMVYVSNRGTGIMALKTLDKDIGQFKKISFIGTEYQNSFKLKIQTPSYDARIYEDNLKAIFHPYYNYLSLINNIYLDNYIAGVVEAEVGKSPPEEYFKLQAIICRTYALNNLQRHSAEGFNVCSKVHCQAYHGMPKSEKIKQAAYHTSNVVIVDSDINLITAAFYSNCGGYTCNSEDVWKQPLPYLRAVKDTFCLNENNAVWKKNIEKHAWKSYLKNSIPCLTQQPTDSIVWQGAGTRDFFLQVNGCQLSKRQIREDWKLKSAFFYVEENEEYITLHGRGFGHGVGLCQEGAMRMARLGFSYPFILHFYYSDVHMIDLSFLSFFKEE